ncbi:MAG: acyltransferase family protein [Deltaproteobacteria bacterium]|nr:acyltransferase family protein [Deltaproteobacteria bacterium]
MLGTPHHRDLWSRLTSEEVEARLDRLDVTFGPYGYDRLGLSRRHIGAFYSALEPLYRRYFRVAVSGLAHVPPAGRAMLIGNHSGGVPVDAAMVFCSLFFDHDPPRHAHGMVEKFAQNLPFLSSLFSRLGQLSGLPEHAAQILHDERLLLVFPEGVRGTGKLFKDRYQLTRFGTGFVRIALQNKSPVVPFAFVGGEEAMPVIYHAAPLARLLGVPYVPIPKHLVPIPKPVLCELLYGAPITLEGDGDEPEEVIALHVTRVREAIAALIAEGRARREARVSALAAVGKRRWWGEGWE